MERVEISELEARLSSYLAGVRHGRTVVVLDRSTPIARIVPYEEEIDDFRAQEPERPGVDLRRVRGVRPKGSVDVVALLREDRDAR